MPDGHLKNPYIGPTAFTESDSDRFFGRTAESRELASLVIARRAVLLYAQSGAGKTSLLQASLVPELKQRKRVETFPITRVMGSVETGGNLYVENALAKLLPVSSADSLAGKSFKEALGPVLAGESTGHSPRLLIFDQFEEIFTFHPELTDQRRSFLEQLGDCLAEYPQLSLLLSMREDYLADLDSHAALLPDRLRTRMRLERLGVQSSVAAIREPSALAGMPFATGVAEELVDNLRRIHTGAVGAGGFALGEYVEPVQLQIVCQQLWARRMEDGTPGKAQIDSDDIGKYANVDDALSHFYRDALAKVQQVGVAERTVRRWFADKLITPAGTRGLVYRGERETGGLPNAAVDILRDCYVVRADLRGGNLWYELAHDRLVDPILADNLDFDKDLSKLQKAAALWQDQDRKDGLLFVDEDLAEAQRWAAKNQLTGFEQTFLEASETRQEAIWRERRQAKRLRFALAFAIALAVTAMLATWYAHQSQVFASNRAHEAEIAKRQAEDLNKQLKETKIQYDILKKELQDANNARQNTAAARSADEHLRSLSASGSPGTRTTIQYFAKLSELNASPKVVSEWKKLGFDVQMMPPKLELPSNIIWYGSRVDTTAVRAVAYSLLANGFALKQISDLRKWHLDAGREHVIQVGWSIVAENSPVLTVTDIKSFNGRNLPSDDTTVRVGDPPQ